MEITPRLLRTPEAARYCGFSKSTFEKLRCYGGGPDFIRRGKSVLYTIDDLDRWLEALPRFSNTSEADIAEHSNGEANA